MLNLSTEFVFPLSFSFVSSINYTPRFSAQAKYKIVQFIQIQYIMITEKLFNIM